MQFVKYPVPTENGKSITISEHICAVDIRSYRMNPADLSNPNAIIEKVLEIFEGIGFPKKESVLILYKNEVIGFFNHRSFLTAAMSSNNIGNKFYETMLEYSSDPLTRKSSANPMYRLYPFDDFCFIMKVIEKEDEITSLIAEFEYIDDDIKPLVEAANPVPTSPAQKPWYQFW